MLSAFGRFNERMGEGGGMLSTFGQFNERGRGGGGWVAIHFRPIQQAGGGRGGAVRFRPIQSVRGVCPLGRSGHSISGQRVLNFYYKGGGGGGAPFSPEGRGHAPPPWGRPCIVLHNQHHSTTTLYFTSIAHTMAP